IDLDGDPSLPSSWRASLANNGTPGAANQTSAAAVRINEVLAWNAGGTINNGATPDYVELFNPGPSPVDISGWSVRPRGFLTGAAVFPPNTSIASGATLVVWCGPPSSGFQAFLPLENHGDLVALHDSTGAHVDSLFWGQQIPDRSVGLVNGTWVLTQPNPGVAINTAAPVAAASQLAVNEFIAQPAQGSQWIELANRDASLPVPLKRMYVQIGNAVQRLRTLSFIAANGYEQIFLGPPSSNSQLDLTLPISNSAITLFGPNAAQINSLAYATTQSDVSQGRLPNGIGPLTSFPLAATPGIANALLNYNGPTLNEVLARNEGVVTDPAGNWPDFIEIFNPGASSFDMSGMKLGTDNPFATDWVFPVGSTVAAGGFLRLWCDSSRLPDATNIGVALADHGGGVWLYNTNGLKVDQIDYGPQARNLSIGKSGGLWRLLAQPTPAAANSATATLAPTTSLRLNEWMARPQGAEDWLELYNSSPLPVELSGLFLTDNASLSGRTNTAILPRSYVAGLDYSVFDASGDSGLAPNATNFRLSAEGEALRLYSPALAALDSVDFGPAASGVSRGRYTDGTATFRDFPGTASRGFANFIDSDGDGLPDAWELANNTNPLLDDDDDDLDQDGRSNFLEYTAGTNPQNPASAFHIQISTDVSGFTIRFTAQQNRTYTVQFKNTLLDATWLKLRDIPAAETRSVEVIDPYTTGTSRFYRVITPKSL
ncbi:MAG TPA: lamin tail domain-containing protein, partial [Chthoniobacteraceae bacterium]|nr:lamin tail domain-containing protein [Chthoniobacteraceae bacterium]